MDDYVHLNVSFIRAMQSGNADAALFFASEIEKKFPGNANVKLFKDVLINHSATLAAQKGGVQGSGATVEGSDDDDDDDSSASDGDEDEEASSGDSSGEDNASDKAKVRLPPTKPTMPVTASSAPRGALPIVAPSIRDIVTMHPSREIDDEVDRMFADADQQVADEMRKYAARKK